MRVAIDQIFDLAIDLHGCCIGGKMSQQMRGKRRDALVLAKQIGHGDEYHLAAAEFVDGDQRFIRRRGNQNLRAFHLHVFKTKYATVQVLWRFVL